MEEMEICWLMTLIFSFFCWSGVSFKLSWRDFFWDDIWNRFCAVFFKGFLSFLAQVLIQQFTSPAFWTVHGPMAFPSYVISNHGPTMTRRDENPCPDGRKNYFPSDMGESFTIVGKVGWKSFESLAVEPTFDIFFMTTIKLYEVLLFCLNLDKSGS